MSSQVDMWMLGGQIDMMLDGGYMFCQVWSKDQNDMVPCWSAMNRVDEMTSLTLVKTLAIIVMRLVYGVGG